MNKILVLLPFYNSEKFLANSINSILNQTHTNLKLVLIDDASTDSSLAIAKQYLVNSNVQLIENPVNSGPYFCLNLGLNSNENVDWDWVITHGADDISYPTRFKDQLNTITPNSIAISCRFDRVNYLNGSRQATNPETNESMLLTSKEVFDRIGYYCITRAAGDTEYKERLKLAFPNMEITKLDKVLVDALSHNNNLTKTIPINSQYRLNFVKNFRSIHKDMNKTKNYYIDFT